MEAYIFNIFFPQNLLHVRQRQKRFAISTQQSILSFTPSPLVHSLTVSKLVSNSHPRSPAPSTQLHVANRGKIAGSRCSYHARPSHILTSREELEPPTHHTTMNKSTISVWGCIHTNLNVNLYSKTTKKKKNIIMCTWEIKKKHVRGTLFLTDAVVLFSGERIIHYIQQAHSCNWISFLMKRFGKQILEKMLWWDGGRGGSRTRTN